MLSKEEIYSTMLPPLDVLTVQPAILHALSRTGATFDLGMASGREQQLTRSMEQLTTNLNTNVAAVKYAAAATLLVADNNDEADQQGIASVYSGSYRADFRQIFEQDTGLPPYIERLTALQVEAQQSADAYLGSRAHFLAAHDLSTPFITELELSTAAPDSVLSYPSAGLEGALDFAREMRLRKRTREQINNCFDMLILHICYFFRFFVQNRIANLDNVFYHA